MTTTSLAPMGDLTVSVLVQNEGFGGLQIRVRGPETQSVTTDLTGTAVFSSLAPGTYTVEITAPPLTVEFSDTTNSVSVPSGGSASTSFLGTWKPGSLVGAVRVDGVALAGEELDLHGPVSRYVSTNLSGHFEFSDLCCP